MYAKFTQNSYKLILIDQNENIEKIIYTDVEYIN